MKRSCSEDLQIENKHIRISGESTEENSELSSDTSTNIEEINYADYQFTQEFVPDEIEKQIVCKSLAMICRSNMYDWITGIYEEDSHMTLSEFTHILCEGKAVSSGITIYIIYNENTTVCNITYDVENRKTENLVLQWGRIWDTIYITKTIYQRYCLVFNREITQTFEIIPEDCSEDAWCYFQDARRHLNRISEF